MGETYRPNFVIPPIGRAWNCSIPPILTDPPIESIQNFVTPTVFAVVSPIFNVTSLNRSDFACWYLLLNIIFLISPQSVLLCHRLASRSNCLAKALARRKNCL